MLRVNLLLLLLLRLVLWVVFVGVLLLLSLLQQQQQQEASLSFSVFFAAAAAAAEGCRLQLIGRGEPQQQGLLLLRLALQQRLGPLVWTLPTDVWLLLLLLLL